MTQNLCRAHYRRLLEHGDVRAEVPLSVHTPAPAACSAANCQGIPVGRGLCRAHYGRARKYGHPLEHVPIRRPESLEQRFWSMVAKSTKPDGCDLWTGAASDGYGVMSVYGKPTKATHVAWFLATGKWPEKHVLHKCDNPPCCRFAHLFEGTQTDNMADMWRKGRYRNGTLTGERHPNAKLTDQQIRDMRRLHSLGVPRKQLALEFRTTKTNVGYIVRGFTRMSATSSDETI